MYDRFRIRVETDIGGDASLEAGLEAGLETGNRQEGSLFSMPAFPPESANLARDPGSRQQTNPHADSQSDPRATRREEAAGAELEGVYIISVAARILDMHPQTLRKYERLGLINPGRTVGMLRLYSREDIRKVFLIRHLMENLGLNLAGVEFALNLVENLHGFKQYLQSAAEGTPVEPVIEPAMAQLFRNLSLPSDTY